MPLLVSVCLYMRQIDYYMYLQGARWCFNTLRLRQNGRHFPDEILKCIFMNEKCLFWFKFHWNLFLRVQLTIFHHWFREWLGADQATSHYLKLCWPSSLTHINGTRGRWVLTPYVLCCLKKDKSMDSARLQYLQYISNGDTVALH